MDSRCTRLYSQTWGICGKVVWIESVVDLSEVSVELVTKVDEARFRALMQEHHFLGDAQPRGETVRYVAHSGGRWLALAMFSASALLCAARDSWIGWERGIQFSRLHLVTNNSRFLVLPGGVPNLGSRVLSLCARRLVRDWPLRFGHEVLLLETFVDPERHRGTVYRAANWLEVGHTRGFGRRGSGYTVHGRRKLVFLYPLHRDARQRLRTAHLDPGLHKGVPKMTLTAAQMRSLPEYFQHVEDPRRRQGRRHSLPTVLSLATAATLAGMRGYKEISEWVQDQSQAVLAHFRPRFRQGRYIPPSRTIIRDVLVRVCPDEFDAALRQWNEDHGGPDRALAVDGKTMRGAVDADGVQTHVMGVVGHDSRKSYAKKKSA